MHRVIRFNGKHAFLQFNTLVEEVQPLHYEGNCPKWKLLVRRLRDNQRYEKVFDGLIICNGSVYSST